MVAGLSRNSCIGILGDGQLGRMLITNGIAPLGYRAAVLGPGGRDSPAGQVAWWAQAWDKNTRVSEKLLKEFCLRASVVLYEWENVPVELVDRITTNYGVPVKPGSTVLHIAQDRFLEKTTAQQLGISVPKFWLVDASAENLPRVDQTVDRPCILKARRNGYDGKGQVHLAAGEHLLPAWEQLGKVPCILEEKIDFLGEVSVIVARSQNWLTTYGPFQNFHDEGILRSTTYPIELSSFGDYVENIKFETTHHAVALAKHLHVFGLLAVEFFVARDGTLVFNEMAPRPHNSGHGTMRWCQTDQFEQYVRAALNLPMGECEPYLGGTMYNVLGEDILLADARLRQGSFVNYGKSEHQPLRKMGHQTISKLLQAR